MTKNAVLRLTLGYLGIIMAISLFFSFYIYRISTQELGRGLRRQFDVIIDSDDPGPGGPFPGRAQDRFESIRAEQLEHASHRLLWQLALLNTTMLAGGAAVSYWLARRHIDPIHEAMEAQSRFTSDAAHELRTPLTAMKTELEVGLRDKKLNVAGARSLLQSNLEEVDKLTALTNALLRLAKTGNQPNTSHWKIIDLKKLVLGATDDYTTAAAARNMTIDTTTVKEAKIKGDADQLREVVIVLLDNAIKYGKNGMTVRLATSHHQDRTELSVSDEGIGIKLADIEHVFERFYRADQSRTKLNVAGYGLGLSLAKTIVEQHGGTISVHSQPNIGTTFSVSLPRPHKD